VTLTEAGTPPSGETAAAARLWAITLRGPHVAVADKLMSIAPRTLSATATWAALRPSGVAWRWGRHHFARQCRRRGEESRLHRLSLFTPRDHARACAFYEREGWTPTGRDSDGGDLSLPAIEYARSIGI
jgi:GNAT superfamily N-acetyltransferase